MSGSEQKRAIVAILLSGLVLFVWQAYFAPKAPIKAPVTIEKSEPSSASTVETSTGKGSEASPEIKPVDATEVVVNTNIIEKSGYKFSLLSDLTITDVDSKDAVFPFREMAGTDKALQIRIMTTAGAKPVVFEIERGNDPSTFVGRNESYGIELAGGINEKGMLGFSLKSQQPYRYQVAFNSTPKELENNQIRNFIKFSNDTERFKVDDDESGEAKIKWFGIDFDYHLLAFVMQNKTNARFRSDGKGLFSVEMIDPANEFVGNFVFTKKNYDTLVGMGDQLDLSVDFGIFGIISVPILRCLQWFYKYFPNYGVAIILLTLLIRMLLFPLSYTSFKSMKKMQKIQPELQALKEKYKDDQARMQKETMELFKKAGANPLGGCLPMLLQMPIFFAFYRVLYGAVELVGAPFFGWITDLSIKDPFYVLPVFMTIAMFAQQKLTPTTTADPTQMKIMMFMPLIFGFIMKDLPAGLNLYIAVSTIFGIGQQLIVYKMTD
ncbi:MAG: membrane protein insertase YidC [Deltaproteobacteria bacterium]|nr:MAG: membrane protein insertase YidC [Deltaproteobacteria bacterium]